MNRFLFVATEIINLIRRPPYDFAKRRLRFEFHEAFRFDWGSAAVPAAVRRALAPDMNAVARSDAKPAPSGANAKASLGAREACAPRFKTRTANSKFTRKPVGESEAEPFWLDDSRK